MPFSLAAAISETALVTLYVFTFVAGGAVGSPHQFWYVELALAFLVLPLGVVIFAIGFWRRSDWRLGCVAGLALGLNLAAFGFYAVMSGGGV